MRIRARIIGFALVLATLGSSARAGAAPQAAAGKSRIVNSVGFVMGNIGGKGPYWFLIDTGANRSALDSKVARDLGLLTAGSSSVEGSAGRVAVEHALVPRLQIGSARVRDLRPTVYDLSGSLAPQGTNVAGILGIDALGRNAVMWDNVHKRVMIGPTAAKLASLRGAAIVPFVLDNHIPRVTARIDGMQVSLRIDTGAAIGDGPTTFVNVTQAAYDQLRARDPSLMPYTHLTATGVGGEIRIPVVKAHALTLGRATVTEPHLIVQQPVGYFGRPDAMGFLGGYSFKRWRGFIVDYVNHRLILLPR